MRSFAKHFAPRVVAGCALVAAILASCDSVAVTSVAVANVSIVPTSVELVTGQSTQLSAIAQDGTGAQLSTASVAWTATPADIVQVDASGRVTALGPGTATVSATTGGVVGNATVAVGVPGLLALSTTSLLFTGAAGEASPPAQSLQIGVGNDGMIFGLETAISYTSGGSGWLTAVLSSDRAPAQLTVRANTGSLPEGTYEARIEVMSSSAANSPTVVNVTFEVAKPIPVILLQPGSLSFTGSATRSVQITNGGDGVLAGLSAEVIYGGAQTGWITTGIAPSSAPASLAITTNDSALPPGTHTARVVVRSSNPDVSPAEVLVTLTGGQQAPVLEVVPDTVYMSASTGNAATFNVDVRNSGTGTLTGVRKAVGYAAGQPTGWLVTTLSSGTAPSVLTLQASAAGLGIGTYQASIEVLANAPNSPVFVPVVFQVTAPPVLPPSAPSMATATAAANATTVTVSWVDNATTETGFEVRRRTPGGAWNTVAKPPVDAQSTVDAAVVAGSTYDYQVRACNSAGCSAWSNTATVTLPVPVVVPAAPTGLSATSAVGGPPVTLTWTDASTNETRFEIRRRLSGAAWQTLSSPAANAVTFIDNTAAGGNAYDYQIRACNSAGCSAWSATASVTVPAPVVQPAAPSGLSGSAAPTGPPVTLNWTDNSTNETRFDVRRRVSGGGWQIITTTGADSASYVDAGAVHGTTYNYRVRACNSAGCSAWSNTITVVVPALPTPPTKPGNPVLSVVSANAIDVTWVDNSTTETRFDLQRRIGSGAWSIIATPTANTTTYSDTGLQPSTQYRYRVRSCNAAGCSSWSSAATATTPAGPTIPRAPIQLAIASASPAAVVITWFDYSDNETHFIIEEGSATTSWKVIGQVPANSSTFTDTVVIRGQLIQYHVKACNAAGCSGSQTVGVLVP